MTRAGQPEADLAAATQRATLLTQELMQSKSGTDEASRQLEMLQEKVREWKHRSVGK
jgi:hypothetical protein